MARMYVKHNQSTGKVELTYICTHKSLTWTGGVQVPPTASLSSEGNPREICTRSDTGENHGWYVVYTINTVTIEVACTIHSYAVFSLALNLSLENNIMVTLLVTIFHSNNLGMVKLMYLSTNI